MSAMKNLVGQKFGRLTVQSLSKKRASGGRILWNCLCDCGTKKRVDTSRLNNGNTKSCGCLKRHTTDLVGMRFGSLVIQKLFIKKSPDGSRLWKCLCDCGKTSKVKTSGLNNGTSRSCGCAAAEQSRGENNFYIARMKERYGETITNKDRWYKMASRAVIRAQTKDIPLGFESRAELAIYLRKIGTNKCPALGIPLKFGTGNKPCRNSPSIDKIVPSKGYVKGNIQVLSYKANSMKSDATPKQLVKFSIWGLKSVLGNDVKILWKGDEL